MEYRLLKNNQQLGPYSVEQIHIFLKQGLALTSDLVWTEGWPSWIPIDNVPGLAPSQSPAASPSTFEDKFKPGHGSTPVPPSAPTGGSPGKRRHKCGCPA